MGSAFSLGKSIVNDTCGMHQVQCAICLKVEGKEKLLVFKLEKFEHVGRCKSKFLSCGVEFGYFHFYPKS
jgi:hypothetical protein